MGVMLEDRRIAQVSINLTNYQKTPIHRVFDMVAREAARYGVTVLESEIIGLVPPLRSWAPPSTICSSNASGRHRSSRTSSRPSPPDR